MKKIKLTVTDRNISKTEITKETIEDILTEGFKLTTETFQEAVMCSEGIVFESNDPNNKNKIDLGETLKVISIDTKIRFEKGNFFIPDLIGLINQGALDIYFVL